MDRSLTRLNQLLDRLKQEGFRLTPQRMAVVKILAYSTEHPGVDQICREVKEQFPMTSPATVYKTVSLLKDMGEIMELGFGDDSNRYDGKPYPHPHLICIRCRRIIDSDLDSLDDLSRELARRTGYRIINHRLDFFGICPDCQAAETVASSA